MSSGWVMRYFVLLAILIFAASAALAGHQAPPQQPPFRPDWPDYIPSGAVMYAQTCSSCHGVDAKGHGPVAAAMKTSPPDLTTISKRHGAKFPRDYVTSVILGGTNISSHGPADMPVWGPIFQFLDKTNKQAVLRRVKNLCDYLESLQQQ